MISLKEAIAQAEEEKVALGHFNISNLEAFWAIIGAARTLQVPVIIGVSEGEGEFVGIKQAVALVCSVRDEGFPVFINADHSYSFERVKEAVDAGFDAVIFDGAKLPIEENIAITKKCVAYARASGRTVLVEGELGYIGTSSKLLDAIPEGVSLEHLTTPEDAARFVRETGIDLFSPSVGNIHGMLKNAKNPRLNIKRIEEIRVAAGIPLVLHGGSGISDEDFRDAIKAGVSTIHINTEIRLAYSDALRASLGTYPDEIAPYKYLKPARDAVEKVVTKRLKLFQGA